MDGGGFSSLATCRAAFKTLWGLEVETDELRSVREELAASGLVEADHPGIKLTAKTVEQQARVSAESAEVEDRAFTDWEADVRQLRSDLTPDEFAFLRQDLEAWLQHLIKRHGAEAALMLYPEEKRAHRLFEEIDRLGTDFLPARVGCAGEVREEALRLFVRKPGPAQRTFLANRLNTAFYLTVLTFDPRLRKLAQQSAEGRRVYLDTNFLYAVLGVADAREVAAAHRLLELTSDLGYQLAVTPWTVNELHTSIKRARQDAEVLPINPGIADLMVQVSGEKGYGFDFWRTFREYGTTARDYFDRVAHFEYEFPKLGIAVVDEGCTAIDADQGRVGDYTVLLDRILRHGRSETVLQHDAKHRLLVERLRGAGNIRFSNARFWFLTQDTHMPRYAELMPDPDLPAPELPFCITPSAWTQVMRALTPRTDNYEQTVVDLLASPFVRYRRSVDQKAVREVVGRMEDQKDRSPELALAVLQDTALVHDIAKSSGPNLEEVDERAYSSKTREMQDQMTAAQEEADREAARRADAEQRADAHARNHEAERIRREGVEGDLVRERSAREQESGELREAIAESERRSAEALKAERRRREKLERGLEDEANRKRVRRRIASALALGLVAVSAAVLSLVLGAVEGAWGTVIVIGAALTAVSGAVRIGFGRKWAAEVVGWVGGLAGIGALVIAVGVALTDKTP